MGGRGTAADQLERLLAVLPAAAADGGATWDSLTDALGVSREVLVADLTTLRDRVFYHPAGGADDLQITLEPDRVRGWSGGEFRRPPRLSLRETLALELGLRVAASDVRPEQRDAMRRLARRLGRALAVADADPAELLPRFSLEDGQAGEDEVRALLMEAARERRACRIRYLKPDASSPEDRVVEPWCVCYGGGRWYAVGAAEESDGIRIFRTDRVLEAEQLERRFEVSADFDPSDVLDEGRVYRAADEEEVAVRYSPAVARWIAERVEGVERADGSLVVIHRVADPGWVVRHVLAYAEDAEILEPEWAREMVRDRVRGVLDAFEERA